MKSNKKILIVTTRYPFPIRGGDKLRIAKIAELLGRNYDVDLASIGKNYLNKKFLDKQYLFKKSFFSMINKIFYNFFEGLPIQNALFFSKTMQNFIKNNHKNYDVIIFHLIRSVQYLPKNFNGKLVLEMTDLLSSNYETILNNKRINKIIKHIYRIEKRRVKTYENQIIKKFNHVILVNKKDIKKNTNKKFKIIPNGVQTYKTSYNLNIKKPYLLFFGNINSLANRFACMELMNEIYPKLKSQIPNIKIKIIGSCSFFFKLYLKSKGADCFPNVKKIENYTKDCFAGICNLKVQSGIQNKILDYASLGITPILYKNCNNFKKLNKKNIKVYSSNDELIKDIKEIYFNKKIQKENFLQNKSNVHKYYSWMTVLNDYKKIIKF